MFCSIFLPSDFRAKFLTTRVTVAGTECPIKKPKAPRAQQSTFSTYKNRNNVKTLIGATPGGLISFILPVFGGSTSERQIVVRCNFISFSNLQSLLCFSAAGKFCQLWAETAHTRHPGTGSLPSTTAPPYNPLCDLGDLVMADN